MIQVVSFPFLFCLFSSVVTPARSVLTEYLPVSPGGEFVLVTTITVQKSIILSAWLKAITDPILEQNKHSLSTIVLVQVDPLLSNTKHSLALGIIIQIFQQFWCLTLEGSFLLPKDRIYKESCPDILYVYYHFYISAQQYEYEYEYIFS